MEHGLLSRAAEYVKKHRLRKRWQKVVTAMAAVVVFCTTYALILPAITLSDPLFCGLEEHTHQADCFQEVLTCGLAEGEGELHVHTDACYERSAVLVCSLTESSGHTHTAECQQTENQLVCASTEEGHVHGDGCYTAAAVFVCGLEETPGHAHGADCWQQVSTLVCTQSTEVPQGGHTHDETCYGPGEEPACGLEEHTHQAACHSDPTADVETAAQWEKTFRHVELTGEYPADVLAIAETQLGYAESERNYTVDEEGRTLGYSRYGAWYGDPYGDWCAMFVSFCLHYAQIPAQDFPREASCQRWIEVLIRQDLYRTPGTYTPKAGDLIFFNWDSQPDSDHVGLVKEVVLDGEGAPVRLETIEGNCSDKVKTRTYEWGDPSVLGFGQLPEGKTPEVPEETVEPQEPEVQEEASVDTGFVSWDSLLEEAGKADISNGPVVYIFGLRKEAEPVAFSAGERKLRGMMFAAQPPDTTDYTDLDNYLKQNQGTYTYILLDNDNQAVPQENGKYIVTEGVPYKLTLQIDAQKGILPGKYKFQMPDGLDVAEGSGVLVMEDGVQVGTWTIYENGLLAFDFNDSIKRYAPVMLSAVMGISFGKEDIDFDGKIDVTVQPPETEITVQKWGKQGDESVERPDTGRIYWEIQITGDEYANIIGNTVTDTLLYGNHSYESLDLQEGLTVIAAEPRADGSIDWHNWTVPLEEPYIAWSQDRATWRYTFPETATCAVCGKIVVLQNDWQYSIRYSTTPDLTGNNSYQNLVTIDDKEVYGWADMKTGDALIVKNGVFRGDEEGGKFHWDMQVTIPGWQTGTTPEYGWYIMDSMEVQDERYQWVANVHNDVDSARVTAAINGTTIDVPNVTEAATDDEFAWHIPRSDADHMRFMELLHRCDCQEGTCPAWKDGACDGVYWYEENPGDINWKKTDFCRCWNVPHNTTFTITYETEGAPVIGQYGGINHYLRNLAALYTRPVDGNGWNEKSASVAAPEIPGIFMKTLTKDYDGYTAHYNITVNEAKLPLTENGTPVTIVDTMTPTLAYIGGSLVITTEDANGNRGRLVQDEDYTVEYDGTGADKHVLTIKLLHPAPVMYILDYDTAVIVTETVERAIAYNNSATVTLWGEDVTSSTMETWYTNINIGGSNYRINILKRDASTSDLLEGVEFGLFNQNGNEIASGETGENGVLSFETDVSAGIILLGHTPYYIQETKALPGYHLDGKKIWFCFCDVGSGCETCAKNGVGNDPDVTPVASGHTFQEFNQPGTYLLPETGGMGIPKFYYALGGLLVIGAAAALGTRKRED